MIQESFFFLSMISVTVFRDFPFTSVTVFRSSVRTGAENTVFRTEDRQVFRPPHFFFFRNNPTAAWRGYFIYVQLRCSSIGQGHPRPSAAYTSKFLGFNFTKSARVMHTLGV